MLAVHDVFDIQTQQLIYNVCGHILKYSIAAAFAQQLLYPIIFHDMNYKGEDVPNDKLEALSS